MLLETAVTVSGTVFLSNLNICMAVPKRGISQRSLQCTRSFVFKYGLHKPFSLHVAIGIKSSTDAQFNSVAGMSAIMNLEVSIFRTSGSLVWVSMACFWMNA